MKKRRKKSINFVTNIFSICFFVYHVPWVNLSQGRLIYSHFRSDCYSIRVLENCCIIIRFLRWSIGRTRVMIVYWNWIVLVWWSGEESWNWSLHRRSIAKNNIKWCETSGFRPWLDTHQTDLHYISILRQINSLLTFGSTMNQLEEDDNYSMRWSEKQNDDHDYWINAQSWKWIAWRVND